MLVEKVQGLHPLRGQNNVQGASDVGLIPMVFQIINQYQIRKMLNFLKNIGIVKSIPNQA